VPTDAQPESRVKRFVRWLQNDQVTAEMYFIPSAEVLLAHVALPRLVLVMDGSVVGRGCIAHMIHVVYKGHALPLVWLVRQGKHGPFPEDLPIAVVEQGQELLPPGAQGVVLGDGACEGTSLQHPCRSMAGLTWSGQEVTSRSCRTGSTSGVRRWEPVSNQGRWSHCAMCV
jgi:hypothetical protein